MDRIEIVINTIAAQRNDALDCLVSALADLAICRDQLAAAQARIAELEKAGS